MISTAAADRRRRLGQGEQGCVPDSRLPHLPYDRHARYSRLKHAVSLPWICTNVGCVPARLPPCRLRPGISQG